MHFNDSSNLRTHSYKQKIEFSVFVYFVEGLHYDEFNCWGFCQVISSEGDIDDRSSLVSEPESLHEVPSRRSSSECWGEAEDGGCLPRPNEDETDLKNEHSPVETKEMTLLDTPCKRDRLQKIAFELLSTERTYVGVLHLIDQVGFALKLCSHLCQSGFFFI